jgi:uncharacterized protein
MNKTEYKEIEIFMMEKMHDSAHDKHHVYRVLNSALDIASQMGAVDYDVLLAACLLHDVGREAHFSNLELCHARIGGDIAYDFLLSKNWSSQKALHVKKCISSHRYRRDNIPESIEAKILFDADKLDVSGAIGIARTLIYEGQVSEPLYILDDDDMIITDGGGAEISSFFQEYNYKLKKIYDTFYTDRAKEIAKIRQKTAIDFYDGLLAEVTHNYERGLNRHMEVLSDS